MADITTKSEAVTHVEAEIAALRADKSKAYSASQYRALDARIGRLQAVVAFLETDEPTDEATDSE